MAEETQEDNDELSFNDAEIIILLMHKLGLSKISITDADIAAYSAQYPEEATPLFMIEDADGLHVTMLDPQEAVLQAESFGEGLH